MSRPYLAALGHPCKTLNSALFSSQTMEVLVCYFWKSRTAVDLSISVDLLCLRSRTASTWQSLPFTLCEQFEYVTHGDFLSPSQTVSPLSIADCRTPRRV